MCNRHASINRRTKIDMANKDMTCHAEMNMTCSDCYCRLIWHVLDRYLAASYPIIGSRLLQDIELVHCCVSFAYCFVFITVALKSFTGSSKRAFVALLGQKYAPVLLMNNSLIMIGAN